MAKKLIGTIPVIGPIIEKGSSFIDMLPKDDDKKNRGVWWTVSSRLPSI